MRTDIPQITLVFESVIGLNWFQYIALSELKAKHILSTFCKIKYKKLMGQSRPGFKRSNYSLQILFSKQNSEGLGQGK